jgi:hypothetical protein
MSFLSESVVDSEELMEGGSKVKEKEKEPELTEEQKAEAKSKNAAATAKAKELLGVYLVTYKGLLLYGFVLQLAGMVGEFASPLFIGLVIDAIVATDMPRVKTLVVYWLVINTVSRSLTLLNLFFLIRQVQFSLVPRGLFSHSQLRGLEETSAMTSLKKSSTRTLPSLIPEEQVISVSTPSSHNGLLIT